MHLTVYAGKVWHDCPVPAPQYCPTPRELDDLELLISGALAPQTTFADPEDGAVSLALTPELAAAVDKGGEVELVDPEGLPLARYSMVEERAPAKVVEERAPASVSKPPHPRTHLTPLGTPAYGPFRRLHLTPAQAREQYAGALTVPVAAPLTDDDLAMVRERAQGRDVVLLALNGIGTPQHVSPVGLVRATLVAAAQLNDCGVAAHVVAAPLPSHGDAETDHRLGRQVAANYGGGEVLVLGDDRG